MSNATMMTRYARLKRQHRCVNCRERLPAKYRHVRCERCLGVFNAWKERAKEKEGTKIDAEVVSIDRSIPRCRCGLALPCNSCLPTIDDIASRRKVADWP